ncbi:ankyrin repeat domain-containing protein [Pantoea sp. 18069]|uniref:ankyrin repeat domain-containing protein n=1 Tax=Pantoea sp. 18069 TaxID=2681415 RepID=UPI00135A46C2|nr:ankyrin repeat domain-containing protein [Pantoea sp. 18069]
MIEGNYLWNWLIIFATNIGRVAGCLSMHFNFVFAYFIFGGALTKPESAMRVYASKTSELPSGNPPLDAKAKANENLMDAVSNRDLVKLKSAIRNGADVNIKDWRGYTPLMVFADLGKIGGVNALINAGADVKIKSTNEGFTALMIAASSAAVNGKDHEVFATLLEADNSDEHVNCAALSGATALIPCAANLALQGGEG